MESLAVYDFLECAFSVCVYVCVCVLSVLLVSVAIELIFLKKTKDTSNASAVCAYRPLRYLAVYGEIDWKVK